MPFKQLPKTDLCGIIHKQFRLRPHGQAVKTPPSHGGNWGSIPHGATKKTHDDFVVCFLFYIRPCISYCPASRYSCTAGRGGFYCPASPLFLHGGARCFLLRASRYSCTAGRGGFYCPASRGAFCMARCVVVIERQIEFFTASCTFYIGILHCTASLAFSLWKNTLLRKIFAQEGVFCDDPATKRSNRKKARPLSTRHKPNFISERKTVRLKTRQFYRSAPSHTKAPRKQKIHWIRRIMPCIVL